MIVRQNIIIYLKRLFPLFDKIIGISHAVVERFNQVYPGIQCEVIYNLIDIAKIKKMGGGKRYSSWRWN